MIRKIPNPDPEHLNRLKIGSSGSWATSNRFLFFWLVPLFMKLYKKKLSTIVPRNFNSDKSVINFFKKMAHLTTGWMIDPDDADSSRCENDSVFFKTKCYHRRRSIPCRFFSYFFDFYVQCVCVWGSNEESSKGEIRWADRSAVALTTLWRGSAYLQWR